MDFLGHLVDAPLANILIIAGLLFLGIGAVGKVAGKIEPDRLGRMVAGLLGLVLLAGGVVTHIRSDSTSQIQSQSTVKPEVRLFSVIPAQVSKGGTVTISWDVLNADDIELEPFGQVPPTGERMIQPEQTTMYRLNATNKGGGKSGTFQEVIVKEKETSIAAEKEKETPIAADDSRNDSATSQDSPDDPHVYASQPPPSLPVEDAQPSDPGGGSRWTPGSWYYDYVQSDYFWVPGAWVTPPGGDVWTPPYWEYHKGRYRWRHGYWGPHHGFYGGIDYGFGYDGSGYHRSANKSRNRVSYNGGPGGIQQQPTPSELAAKRDKHVKPLEEQVRRESTARNDHRQFFAANHGRPPLVAVAKLTRLPPGTDHSAAAEKAKAEKAKADAEKARAEKAKANAEKSKRSANGSGAPPKKP